MDNLTGFHIGKDIHALSDETKLPTFIDCFADLPDPRVDRCKRHKLIDIVFIAVCGVICGAEGFNDIEEFGLSKENWLRQFLELPKGIPSHDTFNRVFARLNPREFQRCFVKWVQGVARISQGEVVAIDGKTLRHSYDKSCHQDAIEMVSAWARENRLTLGQVKVADDSNEITAVPELLRLIEVRGSVVTVDALNTQKEIAAEIRLRDADYLLALKGNHPTLFREVKEFFNSVRTNHTYGYKISTHTTLDGEHARIESREYWQVDVPDHLTGKEEWKDLKSLGMVEARREVQGETSIEERYWLSSLEVDAQRFAEIARGHWSIENSCHWILDVAFREDDSRVRMGYGAENLALIRRAALNMLQQDKSSKRGVKTKRFRAALDERYLLKIINI